MSSCFNRKEVIYTVYQEGSISKAAQKLFISQPSLSIMIRKIEDEIGVPLFDRTSKPLRMTQAGMEYIKAAEAIFAQGAAGCHFGNAIDMAEMLAKAPAETLVMGNVDPVSVLAQGTPETIRAAVKSLVEKCESYPNFVLSSGCDIPASTPWENIEAFFAVAKNQ